MEDVFVPDDERMELATDFASGTKEVLLHSRIFVAWMAVVANAVALFAIGVMLAIYIYIYA